MSVLPNFYKNANTVRIYARGPAARPKSGRLPGFCIMGLGSVTWGFDIWRAALAGGLRRRMPHL